MSQSNSYSYWADWFKALRFDTNTHLGLGDVRLTIAQQEEIIAALEQSPGPNDAQDAARYRWLRDHAYPGDVETWWWSYMGNVPVEPNRLNEVIDAAIAQSTATHGSHPHEQ